MVTLTGTFTRLDGDPAPGTVKFTPSRSPILDPDGKVIISGPQVFPLDKDGKLAAEIPASNDPDLGPAFTYSIDVDLMHTSWKISKVWIPHGSATVDLSEIGDYTPTPGEPTRTVTIPADGEDGQVLVWDGAGFSWADVPEGPQGPPIEDPETLLRFTPGKNLYNPNTDTLDRYLHTGGSLQELEGYRTTDFIRVTPGLPYTIRLARYIAYFDKDRVYISREGISPQTEVTRTVPEDTAYLRVSYLPQYGIDPANQQIEQSATATEYEPYSTVVDFTNTTVVGLTPAPATALTVMKDGDQLEVRSTVGDKQVSIGALLNERGNALFNFENTTVDGAVIHTTRDSITPFRTNQGTIGGNHGFTSLARWVAGAHDKTVSDIGSIWDHAGTTVTLVDVDADGTAWFSQELTQQATGEWSDTRLTVTEDLTHIAGATHTASLLAAQAETASAQMYPAVQNVNARFLLDGNPIEEGMNRGDVFVVDETYEIMDLQGIHEFVTANPGVRFVDGRVRAAVLVENRYEFTAGGWCDIQAAITELSPTRLNQSGFIQAERVALPATRYLPGVKPKDGFDWANGVNLGDYNVSQLITVADLEYETVPPIMTVDVHSDIAFVLALDPWKGAGLASRRIEKAANLWDMRDSRKSYPTVTTSEAPGWGRLEVHGVRAYLTPAEAVGVATQPGTAFNSWKALASLRESR